MERFWTLLTYAFAASVAWWAGLHNAYRLLFMFQVIDIALGILIALRKDPEGNRKFRSNIGLAGVQRRAATWLFILAVAALEQEGGAALGMIPVYQGITIAQGLAFAAAFFEFASIRENVEVLGVKIPRWFIDILKKVEKTLGLSAEEKVKS